MRILIADSLAHTRRNLRDLLELHEGIEVVGETGSGIELLGLTQSLQPDIVILDNNLPDMDGLILTTIIRRGTHRPVVAHPPAVILMTIHQEVSIVRAAQAAGAEICIEKSAGVDPIIRTVEIVQKRSKKR